MNQPSIDWQMALSQHDRWLRTIVLARLREPQAVDEVMQEVALAAVKQAAPISRGCISSRSASRCCIAASAAGGGGWSASMPSRHWSQIARPG
jgi:hypothetical protein